MSQMPQSASDVCRKKQLNVDENTMRSTLVIMSPGILQGGILPSLRMSNPTAEPHRVLAAHERMAEGFRLVFTAPTLRARERSDEAHSTPLL